jgi:fructose-bisphosphate aldolase class 1
MTEKALALRLADAIWPWPGISILTGGQARKLSQAAAELRRLHEVEQQRDELLAALKMALPTLQTLKFEADCSYGSNFSRTRAETNRRNYEAAVDAIAKAEGKK